MEVPRELLSLDYKDFMFALKRYSYLNYQMNDQMMTEMGRELDLDVNHSAFSNEFIKKDGLYCIQRLTCLAFLYCVHLGTVVDVEDEFW